jgi:hypothetical protein
MDSVRSYFGSLKFTTLRYTNAELRLDYKEKNIINPDRYSYINAFPLSFSLAEAGLYVRYAYKEKFLQTPKGNLLSMGTKYPILYFNVIKGVKLYEANNEYLKLETKITKRITHRHIGDTYLTLSGAISDGDLPYGSLYYGASSYSWLNIDNSFNTMRINEFVSNRFASVFFRHDFGSLLYRTEKWAPELVIVSAAGWGDNSLTTYQMEPEFGKNMNKGYFESGIQINNVLKLNFQGYGLGVYYRYGPYSRSKPIENWAFKFNLTFIL